MSAKLQRLIDWAEEHNVNFAHAQIDLHFNTLVFYQRNETRSDFQRIKKAIGMFERVGNPPYVELKKNLYLEFMVDGENQIDDWTIKWNGAYECKSLGYDCGPADFVEEPDEPDEPEEPAGLGDQVSDAVEAWQLGEAESNP